MNRIPQLLILAGVVAVAVYASEVGAKDAKKAANVPEGCDSFLPGNWSGEGTVTGFGRPMRTASTASYKSDGTFTSTTRYLGTDKKWAEQTTTGDWTVESTPSPKICSLTLKSVTETSSASSTTEFTIIDANTYRSFGVDLKRVN